MSYFRARERAEADTLSYRIYVTDSLQAAGQNKYLVTRWAELRAVKPVDTRSGDEIAAEVILRAGLLPTGGETEA